MIRTFFISALISFLILGCFTMCKSDPTVEYLKNEYHTNDIELVWESKADSAYYPVPDLELVNYHLQRAEDKATVDSLGVEAMYIQKHYELDLKPNCIGKIVKYKADNHIAQRTLYYDSVGSVIADNTDVLDVYIKTIKYYEDAIERVK